ncbi:MAG: MMPL family transporter [Marmoricola sp.]|nr:MMPL family transporter [Marmoricola sp.]
MSIFLFKLGGMIARHRGTVVATWVLLLALLGGAASMLGDHFDDSFSIPGTESQQGQDLLAQRFGLTGTSGQILFTTTTGSITDKTPSSQVADIVKAVGKVHGVAMSNPLTADIPVVNTDKTSTLGAVRFDAKVPSDQTLAAVQKAARPPAGSSLTTNVGGDAYKTTSDPSKVPELLGLMVSFLILVLTFGSLIAAGMPILSSLIGVTATITAVTVTSSVVTVSSTAPTLAEMLGLAVGIDYALFILSRHRAQLADGVAPTESMSRALATAGSAVVFAGATVIIALTGLSVAGIPVLTVMGLGAAFAVTVAVLVALTLLPAIALLLGDRLRPRRQRFKLRRRRATVRTKVGMATHWVRTVTRWPVVTVLVVVAALGLVAVPALSLKLALPDNSSAPTNTPQRQTYDAITKAFGVGYNSPLSITANVITSSNPSDTVDKLSGAVKAVPGVVAVTQATPNQGGDTALIQAIPDAGQTAPATAALVKRIRADVPGWEKTYQVSDMMVTGQTAINIDASARLGQALLPFGAIVIGLSLLLLMVVFRSIAVPLKATLGYLLSVGAALGAVVMVFEWGWVDSLFPGISDGPVVSFLPIFVMGVLFGLAMDYEMFLVSAMREHYVELGDAHQAVHDGFRASSRVVTAAALIMTSVFVAFIPAGTATIQQIALGLAVGVAVDAFAVRMTLVPAVLSLLGRRAWWLPHWLDRRLPSVDVEGAALHRRVAFEHWTAEHGEVTLLAQGLVVREDDVPVELVARTGQVVRAEVADPVMLGLVLTGHARAYAGELVVDSLLLPEQRESVGERACLVLAGTEPEAVAGVPPAHRFEDRAALVELSGRHRHAFARRAEDHREQLTAAVGVPEGGTPAVREALVDVALGLAAGADLFVLVSGPRLDDAGRAQVESLSAELARRDLTVVALREMAAVPRPERPMREVVLAGGSGGIDD